MLDPGLQRRETAHLDARLPPQIHTQSLAVADTCLRRSRLCRTEDEGRKRTDKGKGFELSRENQRISRTWIAVAHILNLTRLWQGTDIVESARVTL